MKKRWKGLLCLWMALLVLFFGPSVLAAEGDGSGYIYFGEEIEELSEENTLLSAKPVNFNLNASLKDQAEIMGYVNGVLELHDTYELDGWQIWKMNSGMQPTERVTQLSKDGEISEELFSECVDLDNYIYLLIYPDFKEKAVDPLSVIITIGNHSWSQFNPGDPYDLRFEGKQTASIDTRPLDREITACQYYLACGNESYTKEEMENLTWTDYKGDIELPGQPGGEKYILYAKAKDVAGNTVYASTGGFIVDSMEPIISGITNGSVYEGGTFMLTAGTPYTLGAGSWKVSGDSTIYEGGKTFYVTTDGEYSFQQQ